MAAIRLAGSLVVAGSVTAKLCSKEVQKANLESVVLRASRGEQAPARHSLFPACEFPRLPTAACEGRGASVRASAASVEMHTTSPSTSESEVMAEFMVDMACEGCVKSVRARLEPLAGVKQVDISLEKQTVKVMGTASLKEVTTALEQTGRKSCLVGRGSTEDFGDYAAAVSEFKGPVVHGVVRFTQITSTSARVEATFDGLSPGKHALTVNSFGDLTRGAASTGGVYTPDDVEDPAQQDASHLGVLEAGPTGRGELDNFDARLRLWDLIGRAVVVHDGIDVQESKGIAAVIARSAGVGQNYKKLCLCDGTIIWDATSQL